MITETIKRAVRDRLKIILESEEKQFRWWEETVKIKLNKTRQDQIERRFNKEIQAMKIVIHKLSPYFERSEDVPSIIVKKPKKLD